MVLILVKEAYVIASVGLILSIASSAVIVGMAWGTIKTKVKILETRMSTMETTYVQKEDLAPIKETLAEIRGMFRLELKER